MLSSITRRQGLFAFAAASVATAAPDALPDSFPSQPVDMVRETVGAAHGNFKRLKELVDARPSLAKAAYDWGFGDWEDALGAASHVGNREIADYLIAKGARPTLYSAVMLGQLDVVKAFVAAQPGCQRIAGPHSISLLAHARTDAMKQYLESLGDAGVPAAAAAMPAEEMAALAGTYVFGSGPRDAVEIAVSKAGQLQFNRKGTAARGLIRVEGLTFHPAGASAVRVRFGMEQGKAVTVTVHDPEPVLVGKRS